MNKCAKIELLSPARDYETGIAAVNCGADAVYIGANKFGARRNAQNDFCEIEKLIKYAHVYRAKIYLALNTILKDDELDEAFSIITQAYESGIDGIIIQDMGLLEYPLPPVKLIASTQTDNRSAEKVRFLEECGFSRAILARELSLDQISKISASTSIELEAFVHGALCVSYSGQCYLSHHIGGRSANRGECAQPCRNIYTLKDESGKTICADKHLLCLKDMNRSSYILQMINAGVTSFKIEGRLKDQSYVKNVTAHYRKKIDEALSICGKEKSSVGKSEFFFQSDVEKSFNRSFTDYFLNAKNDDITQFDSPKSLGKRVGKITASGDSWIEATGSYHPGDGISFTRENGDVAGSYINRISGKRLYLSSPPKNAAKQIDVYKNFDKLFEDSISQKYAQRSVEIKCSAVFYETDGGISAELQYVSEDGISSGIHSSFPFEKARNENVARSSIESALKKLGGTEFLCTDVKIQGPIPFIAAKEINELRRTAIETLRTNRETSYIFERKDFHASDNVYPQTKLDFTANVLNRKARDFYFRHGAEITEGAAESGTTLDGKTLMTTKHCLKHSSGMCKKPGRLFLFDKYGRQFDLHFDCGKCEMKITESKRKSNL